MSDYIPPPSFTRDVMKEIRTHHQQQTTIIAGTERIISSFAFRYALSLCAVCFGAVNLARICFTVFVPALCR